MPHFPKPFFKKSHGSWYVEIDRKQHKLGPNKDQAFEQYHELMQARPKPADCSLAVGVIDAFLEWVKLNKSPRTYEWYLRHCQAFARSIPRHLSVGQLKPHHVTALLNKHPKWSSTTKNGLCRAVQRAFRWAEKEELIVRSPVAHLEKPKCKRREVVITPPEFAEILSSFQSTAVRDLLETAWETGARPQELTTVEARHFDPRRGRWVFPAEESKGKEHPRVVYLNERALEITRRRMLRYPKGRAPNPPSRPDAMTSERLRWLLGNY
jgi:integrase